MPVFQEAARLARKQMDNNTELTSGVSDLDQLENQLEKLAQLKAKGLITDEEFAKKKAKLLNT